MSPAGPSRVVAVRLHHRDPELVKINASFSVASPYLWPNLSPETQTQIARILRRSCCGGCCRRDVA